jgi:cellulose synthase/poly-beta-1,6-N-acetylglucosamine synthase-like glycosyltransferase
MEELPLISCIMPTYGRPRYVDESVAMFLEQDYPRRELIVLNDCEGQTFEGDFPGVRIVNHDRRFSSLGEKRNECIRLARGSIVAIWDDDDVYLPWRLSLSWREMERLDVLFYRPAEFWAYWGEQSLHDNQTIPGWFSHPTVLFSKDLWEKVGGYPPLDIGEDAQFFEKIHRALGETFIKYEIESKDRFFILRGVSHYHHTSISGGTGSLDTKPGIYRVKPREISDPTLRSLRDRLVSEYNKLAKSVACVPVETTSVKRASTHGISICISLKNRSRVRNGGKDLFLFPNSCRCSRSTAFQTCR